MLGKILACSYITRHGQIFIFWNIPGESPFLPNHPYSNIPFCQLAVFAYHVVNYFFSVTYNFYSINFINFCFIINGSSGIILCNV